MLSIKVIGQNTLINTLIDQCKSSTKYSTDIPANMYVIIQANNVSCMFLLYLYLHPALSPARYASSGEMSKGCLPKIGCSQLYVE